MDIYGMSLSGPDSFGVDELFDFSGYRNGLFSSTIVTDTTGPGQCQYAFSSNNSSNTNYHHSTDFTDCVPSDDVAELEWLSNFVDDSFTDFPANNIAGTINFRPENSSFHTRSRSKRTRASPNNSTPLPTTQIYDQTSNRKTEPYSTTSSSSCDTVSENGIVRRCTHCASEKTPQWRTGPLGPKTLCNACGVRYKSGRLVPEYRPAASPTFVLTQHSNSHRKVMELRRQKEAMVLGHQQQQFLLPEQELRHRQQQQQQQRHLHHRSKYEIC